MWVKRSLKVIQSGTIWKLGYGFLFAFHSYCGHIFSHFGHIQRQAMAWPWNVGLGSIKVIENGVVRQTIMTFYYSAIVTNYRTTVCELFDVEYAACFPSARTPPPLLSPTFPPIKNRVTTCMENLEKSWILTAVKEMSEILLKVGEVSGKKSCQEKWPKTAYLLFIVSCMFASVLDFAEYMHFILVSDHAPLHSYPHHWH